MNIIPFPSPHKIFQARPQILAAKLIIFQRVTPAFFTSTTHNEGATSNTSAAIASCPFRPRSDPCIFTFPSFLFTRNFNTVAISSSLDTMLDADCFDVKRASRFTALSTNRPDRSNPQKAL